MLREKKGKGEAGREGEVIQGMQEKDNEGCRERLGVIRGW